MPVTRPLFGSEPAPESQSSPTGDLELGMRIFVNRWVILEQQRPTALAELRDLIAEAKGQP